MINRARQCPWGWETQSWSVSLPSRAGTKSRAGRKTGSMSWSSNPIWNCQYMWYSPYMGKDTAIPYIEISCYPSAITWSMMNVKMLWREILVRNPLQCYMQMMHYQSTGWPKGTSKSLPKQHELVGPGLTVLARPNSADEGLQADDNASAQLRQNARKVRNQLPLRYQNFAAWQNDTLPCTFDMWVGLCLCLYIVLCLYMVFMGVLCEETLLQQSQVCQTQMIFGIGGHTIDADFMVDFWMGGVDQKIFGSSTAAPLEKQKDNHVEALWVSG